jgi:hypothetical protein
MNPALAARREPDTRLRTSFEVVASKPLATTNLLMSMHWQSRTHHIKKMREKGKFETVSWFNLLLRKGVRISTNCRVKISFTRYGQKVDDDNLRGSFKALRDGIADAFCEQWKTLNAKKRGDDSDERFSWHYDFAPKRGSIRGLVEIDVIQ